MRQQIVNFIHRFPWLYSALYHASFLFSPRRMMAQIRRLPAHRRHLKNSTLIAGPRDLEFAGGIFNPGAVPTNDGGVLLLAKGQACHWWNAVGIKASLYGKGSPVLFVLDQTLKVTDSRIVPTLSGFEKSDQIGYEDFRLFRYQSETWVNHGLISIIRPHACAATCNGARQCLSRLDWAGSSLVFVGQPQLDFPIRPVEKNWLYVEHQESLYLFYSFHPFRVLKLTDRASLTFKTVMDRPLEQGLADIGGYGTMVSFSTNPIDYDGRHWLILVHQVQPGSIERCYHHWGVLIDKETLLPCKVTSQPLFSGMGARGRKPGILYVSSVVKRKSDFIFFMGEGDAYTTQVIYSMDEIEKQWVDVHCRS